MTIDKYAWRDLAIRMITGVLGALVMGLGLLGVAAIVVVAVYAFASLGVVLGLIASFLGAAFFFPFFAGLVSLGISLMSLGRP